MRVSWPRGIGQKLWQAVRHHGHVWARREVVAFPEEEAQLRFGSIVVHVDITLIECPSKGPRLCGSKNHLVRPLQSQSLRKLRKVGEGNAAQWNCRILVQDVYPGLLIRPGHCHHRILASGEGPNTNVGVGEVVPAYLGTEIDLEPISLSSIIKEAEAVIL